jgi:dolichol-phosphate mannosyltransferase
MFRSSWFGYKVEIEKQIERSTQEMEYRKFKATYMSPAHETSQLQLPLTPWPGVPPTDGTPQLALPLTPWHAQTPVNEIRYQNEVPNPFSFCDETTHTLSTVLHDSLEVNHRQFYQQSYHPTGWKFADRVLDITDTLTRGRADWFQRLFSFLFVGGLGAVVNLACFSIIYYLLVQSIYGLVAYLVAFITATEVSIVTNFVLNDHITFRHLHGQTHSWRRRCVRFHVTSVGGTLLTLGISFSFLHLLHISALLSQGTALIIATAFNFVFHHIFTYRHGRGHSIAIHNHPPAKEKHSMVEQIPGTAISDRETIKMRKQVRMKTLIIIPTYNEIENLPLLLKQIFSYAAETDVLIVDDNSPDGTGQLAEEIHKANAQVNVLHRPGKLGLGTAYIAGFKYAIEHGYDAAFEMDADFSHDPRYLPDFLKAIEHADLVIGSRYIPGGSTPNWSATRRLISASGNIFARFMLGIPVHDCTGGFRCYRRSVLQNIDLNAVQSRGYAFQVELTYRVMRQGYKIFETPITFMDRRLGKSKMSRKIVIEAFTYVLRTRFSKQPARMMARTTANSDPQDQLCILRVEVGKESGCFYEVPKKSMSIGRTHESDICLKDPAISRLHASIVRADDAIYTLIDEGSVNGTKLNGSVLNKYQPYSLQEGDKIQLGQTVLVFSKR